MRARTVPAVLAVTALLAGCGGSGEGSTLTVFTAASLTDVFEQLGAELEEQRPGLEVRFSVAGSSTLAAQLVQGAPTRSRWRWSPTRAWPPTRWSSPRTC
jgi:molybdate transport system substrate-binding protein